MLVPPLSRCAVGPGHLSDRAMSLLTSRWDLQRSQSVAKSMAALIPALVTLVRRPSAYHDRGKSAKQQRPEGLRVSHAHVRFPVSCRTNVATSGLFTASIFVTPKQ